MELDREYQEELIAEMTDDGFMSSVSDYLTSELFDEELRPVVVLLLDTYAKHGKTMSLAQLKQKTGHRFRRAKSRSSAFDEDLLREMSQYCHLRSFLVSCRQRLDDDGPDAVYDELQSLRSLNGKTDKRGRLDFFDTTKKEEPTRDGIVSSGISSLDVPLGGGLAREELGLIVAPTNGGKSTFLVHLGATAMSQKKSVLHVTLEMTARMVKHRYQSSLLGMTGQDILNAKPAALRNKMAKIKRTHGGLVIKQYPTGTMPLHELHRSVEEERPDVVILDYADLVMHSAKSEAYRLALKGTYEELRAIAQTYRVALWTASQANKQSYSKSHIGTQDAEEAISKGQISDIVVTLNQTEGESMTDDSGKSFARLWLSKNRVGPKNVEIPISCDYAMARFEEA